MKVKKAKRQSETLKSKTLRDLGPWLKECFHDEQVRLSKSRSIVACCRLATASLYEHGNGDDDEKEVITQALLVAYELILETDDAVGTIGDIVQKAIRNQKQRRTLRRLPTRAKRRSRGRSRAAVRRRRGLASVRSQELQQ